MLKQPPKLFWSPLAAALENFPVRAALSWLHPWALEQRFLLVNPVAITGWMRHFSWVTPILCAGESCSSGEHFLRPVAIALGFSSASQQDSDPWGHPFPLSHGLCSLRSGSLHELSKIISCTKLCKNLTDWCKWWLSGRTHLKGGCMRWVLVSSLR